MIPASSRGINPDPVMTNKPGSAMQNTDSAEGSSFARLINNEESSSSLPDEKPVSHSESEKNDNGLKSDQTEGKQEIENDTSIQQVSQEERNTDDTGTEDTVSGGTGEQGQDAEGKQTDVADNDIQGDAAEDTDIADHEAADEGIPAAEPVAASFEQARTAEMSIPDQGSEQADGKVSNAEGATVTETGNMNYSLNTGETPVKDNTQIIDMNTGSGAASARQQGSTSPDRVHINNENKDAVIEQAMDEIPEGELTDEDGLSEESGAENKTPGKHAGFGSSDLEELSEDIEPDGNLNKKIRLSAKGDLPDRYVKKTVTEQTDNKTVQSHINAVDPEVLEELNDVKTLQDRMVSGGTHPSAIHNGTQHVFKGEGKEALHSLEAFQSHTAVHSAETAQNQAVSMAAGKAGAGLTHGHAARTAGFSELLNHVVYVAKGRNRLGVTINHEEFGKLKINVSMDRGMLNIHVNASDKAVREFLESNVQNIVESLNKDGVSVGGFSVALKDHKDNPEKQFLMDSGISRQYEHVPAAVQSARGLVNVFA